ncbi:hypothetical protein [Mycobacterium deserti]|uniref:PE-PGRS family protein n=1 Tax=Mycobacterium deserti TaxID=2978347 RepID=A0ABT2M8D4_9MYCO|nr:hypothetical protein [Mycobacterium deserti]MCT7658514.1 hypothetical protein [Mycobacterium deserti]
MNRSEPLHRGGAGAAAAGAAGGGGAGIAAGAGGGKTGSTTPGGPPATVDGAVADQTPATSGLKPSANIAPASTVLCAVLEKTMRRILVVAAHMVAVFDHLG